MSNICGKSLRARAQELAELIVHAKPVKVSFESEEQFLAMLSLGSAPVRMPARQQPRQYFAQNCG